MSFNFKFCSIASGSSGNSYLIKSSETAILVDAGISGKRIKAGIEGAGVNPEDVEAMLITHEHSDHIKSVRIMQKHCPYAKVYSTIGTWEYIKDVVEQDRQIVIEEDRSFKIRDIEVTPFAVSHDASQPVGFTFSCGESKISIVTDTGIVTEDIQHKIAGSDLLVLEANHDEGILMMCEYPYAVKRRIKSELGHLSNEAAGACICEFLRDYARSQKGSVLSDADRDCSEEKKSFGEEKSKSLAERKKKIPAILLAHLSKRNNSREIAMVTVKNVLDEEDIFKECGIMREELHIDVLSRNEPGKVHLV